jgi:hypothetical protein
MVHEDAALELHHGRPGGPELLHEVVRGHLGLEDVAAGEDVDGGVAILRPRVNRQVRLGDDDDSADAERVELVKHDVDDGGLSPLGRFHHGRLHGVQTVDGLCVAVEQLEQQVTPQCLHPFPPPQVLVRFLRQFSTCRIFLHCGAIFFPLQEKNGRLSRSDGGASARRDRSASPPSGAEVNFLLAFVG